VDLIVPIVDETLDAELAGVQHAFRAMAGSGVAPLCEAETRALVKADTWRWVSFPAGNTAGAGKCYEHVAGTTRVSRSLGLGWVHSQISCWD